MKAKLPSELVVGGLALGILGYMSIAADSDALRGGAMFCLWAALGGVGIIGGMTGGGWLLGLLVARRQRPGQRKPP